MNKRLKFLILSFLLLSIVAPAASFARSAEAEGEKEGMLIGRISHVEGKLLRYVSDEKDWVVTVKDAPFGLEDALYSDENTRAEFIMPNSTWIRIGSDSQVQLIALKNDSTTVDMASGVGRFYNKNRDGVVKVTTPFGYVVAPGDTTFDLYVGDESLEVIAIRGDVDFVHESTKAKYDVKEGEASIIADNREVSSGQGTVDSAWDDWNAERDSLWTKRLEVKGDSVRYLPEPIRDESYTLEENGRWEEVEYEGARHRMWRPTHVAPDWRPYTTGRWTVYYGDNCWVPDEPFGYVTHHYGSWVFARGGWFWAPPVWRPPVIGPPPFGPLPPRPPLPLLSIGFGWNPGRVGWIHSGVNIGWVPLAPREVYYGQRHWGPHTTVVNNVNINRININVGGYRYANEAVVVNRDSFYSVRNYAPVMVRNVNKTVIVNNYRPAPVVNNTVINNYNTNRQRYQFTNVEVNRKPHAVVVNRINANQQVARQAQQINRRAIEQDVARVKTVNAVQTERVRPPKVTNKLVEEQQVNKPASEVQFRGRELKRNERERRQTDITATQQPQKRKGSQPGVEQAPAPGEKAAPEEPRRVRSPREKKGQGDTSTQQLPGEPGGLRESSPKPMEKLRRDGPVEQPSSPGDSGRVRPPKPRKEGSEPGSDGTTVIPNEGKGGKRENAVTPEKSGTPDTGRVRPPKPHKGSQEGSQDQTVTTPEDQRRSKQDGQPTESRQTPQRQQREQRQIQQEPQRQQQPPQRQEVEPQQRQNEEQQQRQQRQIQQEQQRQQQQQRPQVEQQQRQRQNEEQQRQQKQIQQEQQRQQQQQRPQVEQQQRQRQNEEQQRQQKQIQQEQQRQQQQQRPQVEQQQRQRQNEEQQRQQKQIQQEQQRQQQQQRSQVEQQQRQRQNEEQQRQQRQIQQEQQRQQGEQRQQGGGGGKKQQQQNEELKQQ